MGLYFMTHKMTFVNYLPLPTPWVQLKPREMEAVHPPQQQNPFWMGYIVTVGAQWEWAWK